MAVYTTQARVERLLSEHGVMLRLDDLDADLVADAMQDSIDDAQSAIDLYLTQFYEDTDLATSTTVTRWATWLAAHFLSQRRGNPSLYLHRYEEIMDQLEGVMDGRLLIPGIPTRDDFTPAVSNFVIDERFHLQKMRVQPSLSSGGTSSRQMLSYEYPYDWL